MKVIIAGGREIELPFEKVEEIVNASGYTVSEVVSGGASGVDKSGESWAVAKGIPVLVFPAEWAKYRGRAGTIRNAKMAVYADALIAVPGTGPGTQDMIRAMRTIQKPVFVWREDEADNAT